MKMLPTVIPLSQLPSDITLAVPDTSQLPPDQLHFLFFIPWDVKYLRFIPHEFRDFFMHIMPYLKYRTTDVHTAICAGYLDILLSKIAQPINRRVVAISLLLHDAGWSALSEVEIAASLGVSGLKLTAAALGPKQKHAIESEKIARDMLRTYQCNPPLNTSEIDMICQAILYHDKPEEVAGADSPMPLEVQALVDLDHLWSFTHENFWQDVVRKGIDPSTYLLNLNDDLDSYFVTDAGKQLARELWAERKVEVQAWLKNFSAKVRS